jgi:hypothetical protein
VDIAISYSGKDGPKYINKLSPTLGTIFWEILEIFMQLLKAFCRFLGKTGFAFVPPFPLYYNVFKHQSSWISVLV